MDAPDDVSSPAEFSAAELDLFREVNRSLRGLRYGTVVLNVHEGRVVEIHRTEKIRRGIAKSGTQDGASR